MLPTRLLQAITDHAAAGTHQLVSGRRRVRTLGQKLRFQYFNAATPDHTNTAPKLATTASSHISSLSSYLSILTKRQSRVSESRFFDFPFRANRCSVLNLVQNSAEVRIDAFTRVFWESLDILQPSSLLKLQKPWIGVKTIKTSGFRTISRSDCWGPTEKQKESKNVLKMPASYEIRELNAEPCSCRFSSRRRKEVRLQNQTCNRK
jgi:hypothetical protein